MIGCKDSLIGVIPTGRSTEVLVRDSGFVNLKSRFHKSGFKNVSVLPTLDKKVANKDSTVELHYAAIYDSSYHDKYYVLQKGDR